MRKVTGATTATNGQFQVLMVNKVLKGDLEPGFTVDLAFKDMSLAMNAAAEQRVGLPVGATVSCSQSRLASYSLVKYPTRTHHGRAC